MGPTLRAVPLLALPALLYAALAFSMGDASFRPFLAETALSMRLPSGADFVVGYGHLLIMFAAGLFFVEILKSTRPTGPSIIVNSLAMLLFALCLGLFLIVPEFGTMEFFLIMAMLLLDFLAGAIVMIFVARRDVAWGAS